MAWSLPDKNGNCCGCEVRFDPCDCGTPCASIECATRGGLAELCGFEEYIPSSPPRRFKTETRTRQYDWIRYDDTGCTVPAGPGTIDLGLVVSFSGMYWHVYVSWAYRNSYTEVRPVFGGVALLASDRGGQLLVDGVPLVGFNDTGGIFGSAASDSLWRSTDGGPSWGITCTITGEDGAPPVYAEGGASASWDGFGRDSSDTVVKATWDCNFPPRLICRTFSDGRPKPAEDCTPTGEPVPPEGATCATGALIVQSSTLRGRSATGDCCTPTIPGIGIRVKAEASDSQFTDELSEEDTESDAIARLLSNASWSGWGALNACVAAYQARESTAFIYQEAKWRTTLSAPTPPDGTPLPWPAVEITVRVGYQHRPFGVGEFRPAGYFEGTFLVTPGSPLVVEEEVPNTRGWETRVSGCAMK